MLKRLFSLAALVICGAYLYGCIPILAGAAGAGGAAVWLSGKLTQDFTASYDQTVSAARQGVDSLGLAVQKETRREGITQLRTRYEDGREVWLDVRRMSDSVSRVEVRVGAVGSNKEAATKIMNAVENYLPSGA